MTDLDLSDLRAKAEAATPGPWNHSTYGTQVLTGDSWSTVCVFWERTGDKFKTHNFAEWEDGRTAQSLEANAAYIAAASPSTILSLIDRVERLEEALKLVHRLFLPIHMQLAEAELCDEFVSDGTVLFSFMGSGASDHVTVGDYRKAIESVRSALTPDT